MTTTRQLSRREVVLAGLEVLDTKGLDRLTMRDVAARLGVQLNTIYWHAKSKQALLELMADELLRGVTDGVAGASWTDSVRALARNYRGALLSRRDGGRLCIARFTPSPNTVLLSERLHEAFLDGGLPPAVAAHAAWQLSFLILASAIEEQGDPADWKEEFLRSSPAIAAGGRLAEALRSSANIDHHERFEFGLDVLLAGIVHVH